MALKKYRFPITVGVADPAFGTPEVRDSNGMLVRPASTGIRHVPPGEPVEMEEAEAKSIIARYGEFKDPAQADTSALPVSANRRP